MLHDADCGFCTRAAALVPRLGVDVDDVAIQDSDLAAYGIDAERALREMPLVRADGTVLYGHHAWSGILLTGPGPMRLLGRLLVAPGVDRVAARVYRWVSDNRERMPGGTPACSLDARAAGPSLDPSAGPASPQGTRR